MTPGNVILALKVAVASVTVLLIASIVALAAGKPRVHGRINFVFFGLTLATVIGFEIVIRIVIPDFTAGFSDRDLQSLRIHLAFSIPSAVVLPVLLYSGWIRRFRLHIPVGCLFLLLWGGTAVTGIFFLPHELGR